VPSVSLLVVCRNWLEVISKTVNKKRRKECIPVGRNDKEGSRRLDIYREMPRH